MGMILLWNGYYKEPIAIDSIIKRCNFLMKLDKTFKENCTHKPWGCLGRHTEILVKPNLRPSLTVYMKCNKAIHYIAALFELHMPAILARDVLKQSSWLSYKCSD